MKKIISLFAGPVAGALLYFIARQNNLDESLCRMIFVTVWVATWWVTGAIDIGVTSFLPLVLMPLLGIMKTDDVAVRYMEHTIFLFIGGFILGFAMEKWNLHNRIAYRIMLLTGSSPSRILAGIMLTSFLMSMWMSNTATTLMLLAAVIAIIKQEELFREEIRKKMAAAMLIGLAYSATIGGMATLVGTPTNMIFAGYWETNFSSSHPITFVSWSVFAFPLSLILLICTYFLLRYFFLRKIASQESGKTFIQQKYNSLGPLAFEQKAVLTVFSITVVLWFSRSGFDFGSVKIQGWESIFPKGYIRDSTVAIMMATLLFLIPASNKKGFILEWPDVIRLPLRIILLFGAGFALAEGFEVTGMGTFLAKQLSFFKTYPLWVIILMVALTVTVLSEFASNVASITLMLPVLKSLSVAIGVDPWTLMMPATIAASFGFMMPVATAPNTIAFSTGHIRVSHMMKSGLILNLVSIGVLVLMSFYIYSH